MTDRAFKVGITRPAGATATAGMVVARGPAGPPGAASTIPGPPGADGGVIITPAVGAVGGHRVARLTAAGAVLASNDNIVNADSIVGVTTNAAADGDPLTIVVLGEITEPSWSFTPNGALFLGVNGLLTQTPPTAPAAAFLRVVGVAISPTVIFVRTRQAIVLT